MGVCETPREAPFGWPSARDGESKVILSHEELALLLGGIDLAGSKRRAWYRKVGSAA